MLINMFFLLDVRGDVLSTGVCGCEIREICHFENIHRNTLITDKFLELNTLYMYIKIEK